MKKNKKESETIEEFSETIEKVVSRTPTPERVKYQDK
jgi:hypothetical protein